MSVGLRLRNTLGRTVEPFVPIEPGHVRMYTCGPTVYRYAHVGNLRSYLLADILRRAFLAGGLEVRQVKNITDVGHLRDDQFDRGEDKMLVQARLEDKSPEEIARAYEAAFHQDERLLNILPAQVFPRATEHIADMVAMTERLVDAGFAYEVDGTVYFSVGSFPGYGRLSGNTLDELRAGHRGEVERDKRDPADFALWKRAGERRLMRWPTPRWGEGFPGWHIECSAMSLRHLGEVFDVHTGGVDNVFPHHEDEIAQSAALSGRVPAHYWVHGEHLLMAGRRMAKSAGNFVRVTELAGPDGRPIEPLAFRYLCFTAHYRAKLNLTAESLASARAGLAGLRARARRAGRDAAGSEGPGGGVATRGGEGPGGGVAGGGGVATRRGTATGGGVAPLPPDATGLAAPAPGVADPGELSPDARAFLSRWTAAVDDDLDLPRGLAVVHEIARSALPAPERRWLLLEADRVLGLDLDREIAAGAAEAAGVVIGGAPRAGVGPEAPGLPGRAAGLVREREAARAARDYARADALRAELAALGVEVVDRPGGVTEWRQREG